MKSNESNVSRLAYELWETAGRPAGRDLEFWLAAERKLRASATSTSSLEPAAATAANGSAADLKTSKTQKNGRGTKKNWPKPYPALPKF